MSTARHGCVDSAYLRSERAGGAAVIAIDFSPADPDPTDTLERLLRALRSLAGDDAIKAAVLLVAGNGDAADAGRGGSPIEAPQLPLVIEAIAQIPKTVIGAMQGEVVGGVFGLALACDARVAAANAAVALPALRLGRSLGAGVLRDVPRLVGVATAIDIICSGRRVGAAEAVALGLIDISVDGDLRTAAIDLALAWGKAGRKRRLGDAPVPPDAAGSIESAVYLAMRAGADRQKSVAAIEAIKSAALLAVPAVRR